MRGVLLAASVLFVASAVMVGPASVQAASVTKTLIDETFSSGSGSGVTWTSNAVGVSNGQKWVWSSPDSSTTVTGTEAWVGTGGASARGLSTTYDHDQNGGTANINIPGGFETMSNPSGATGTVRVAAQVVLPELLGYDEAGLLTFFAANRIASGFGGNTPRVGVYNVTDARDILPLTALNYPGGNASWNFKSLGLSFLASDAGDTIEVRFQESVTSGGGIGARGLEVADVTLQVAQVPEPITLIMLLGPGGAGLLTYLRRCR